MSERMAITKGALGTWQCPYCGNGSDNGIPYGSYMERRCASCKSEFTIPEEDRQGCELFEEKGDYP